MNAQFLSDMKQGSYYKFYWMCDAKKYFSPKDHVLGDIWQTSEKHEQWSLSWHPVIDLNFSSASFWPRDTHDDWLEPRTKETSRPLDAEKRDCSSMIFFFLFLERFRQDHFLEDSALSQTFSRLQLADIQWSPVVFGRTLETFPDW